ncbi:hypothetical protein AJ80_09228 [Polytolypa hystricis UAMH7299]|uniref:histidine kinase n=1 Tax=Polytolypa hystricis (strain UAMH7299) TaxID=1447883 RepID=A0A2B7WU43_POLH7|nr:hypothetical protein AJ80_09228 [Polytolypa hystricis UAMH7299]
MRTPPLPSSAKAPSTTTTTSTSSHRSRRRSSRSHHSPSIHEGHDSSPSSMQQRDASGGDSPDDNVVARDTVHSATGSPAPSITRSPNDERPSAGHSHRHSTHTLEELRRRMEETIISQQAQTMRRERNPDAATPSSPQSTRTPLAFQRHGGNFRSTPSSPSAIPIPPSPLSIRLGGGRTDSSSSSRTIKSPRIADSADHSAYPFPSTVSQRLHFDHRQGSSSASPSSEGGPAAAPATADPPIQPTKLRTRTTSAMPSTKDAFLPPQTTVVPDDPTYPCPNLYDIALALNVDPGLDAWWSNVAQILQTHYGMERATLAVPGDATDLENVPWGQKATYCIHGYEPATVSPLKRSPPNQKKVTASPLRVVTGTSGLKETVRPRVPTAKRPPLIARHSFAGFGKGEDNGTKEAVLQRRPEGLLRTKSTHSSTKRSPPDAMIKSENDASVLPNQVPLTPHPGPDNHEEYSPPRSPSAAVFPVPRALDVEADPLIKRTGVVKLFGRTKPAILTREYIHDPMSSAAYVSSASQGLDDANQPTPDNEPVPQSSAPGFPPVNQGSEGSPITAPQSIPETFRLSQQGHVDDGSASKLARSYEEYEQHPPSPWSQSPAPSPAPRSHPEQNPFFNPKIDEEAFASSPPMHDYSQSQPLQAIGVDRSKTVIHIPLLHSTSSKLVDSNTLQFPVAIISILTSIVPYPSNLRQSLALLLPHLTTSFCLAQHYSQLEKQISVSCQQHYGSFLGLGGTFSEASSGIELLAGLGNHVNYPLGEDERISGRSGVSSPLPPASAARSNSAISSVGTPGLELGGFTGTRNEFYFTPGPMSRHASETSDSYFNMKQSVMSLGQQRLRQGKAIPNQSGSTMRSPPPVEHKDNSLESDDGIVGDSRSASIPPAPERSITISSATGSPPGSSRHPSSTSITTQLHRESPPRPFPDTIAQLMLNSVPLHLFLAKTHTGEVVWTNDKFDAYRGNLPQDRRVRDPWQNVHPDERENLQKAWMEAFKTGSQFSKRVRVKSSDDDEYKWFIFLTNPLFSQTGSVLYWIGSFLDVHKQHIKEREAAQERETFATEAKFRALANSIPQVVFEAAEYRGLISANEQWHLYTGQSLEDAQNFGFAKHIHRDDLEKCGILLPPQSVPESENPVEFGRILAGLPKEFTSESSGPQPRPARPIRSLTVNDINRPFQKGVTNVLQALVERKVVTIQKDENGRDSYTTEIRFRSKGGDFRWHLVRLVKVETPDFGNGEASWYGTCTDINDRKLLERELNTAMHKLNKEMESKTKFFSNMSHEIRTPLNGILGTIPFILDTQLDNDQRRMLDTIQNSSTNLRELVDNILDVSKVEAGKMNMVQQWFHVRSVLEDAIDTIASRAIDKGLELNYSVEAEVPAMVIGDRFRIRQILINLMGNAVKFTSHGEIYTRCSILDDPSVPLGPSELLLNFEVVDTGKGFSTTDAQRLMQRFSQIESNNSQEHSGSGLGLFLSKQLVEMHSGRLTPTSKEGQGAKFSFFVKVKAPSATPEAHASQDGVGEGDHVLTASQVIGDSPSSNLESGPLSSPIASVSSSQYNIPDASVASSRSSTHPTPGSSAPASGKVMGGDAPHAEQPLLEVPPQTSPRTSIPLSTSSTQPVETKAVPGTFAHPKTYSVLIICPFDYARESVKHHIEQVIPHEVPSNVTSILDVDDWKDMMISKDCPVFTHVVLNIPDDNEVMEVMQYVLQADVQVAPALVIVSDLYQKRAISQRSKEIQATGRKIFIVPKPVKPSAFSKIFDPDNKRDLSKDRNQDMAREVNNNFKTMAKIVKEVLGNKGYRILLVEDDETNRMVMLKYLEKVRIVSETAANGQECVDMVCSKVPGYYSLIICDIQMPVKNGYETCREIRAWESKNHFPQIPIMALSANAMMDQIDDASRAGFNDYLTKPIKHNELGKMMMELLDTSAPQTLLKDRTSAR